MISTLPDFNSSSLSIFLIEVRAFEMSMRCFNAILSSLLFFKIEEVVDLAQALDVNHSGKKDNAPDALQATFFLGRD